VSKLVKAAATDAPPIAEVITGEPSNNVTENIYNKIGVNLHKRPAHPLNIIRQAIYEHFDKSHPKEFKKFDDLYPIVTTQANFDSVLVPPDHVSRSYNDTYYVAEDKVLRCSPSDKMTVPTFSACSVIHFYICINDC
jgi:phenylalanyl-tRNA synthetase alpha chain